MPYEFTDSDLHISLRQLQEHLNEASQETKDHTKLFHYLILECNYGARITEPSDKKLLEGLMSSCCCAQDILRHICRLVSHSLQQPHRKRCRSRKQRRSIGSGIIGTASRHNTLRDW